MHSDYINWKNPILFKLSIIVHAYMLRMTRLLKHSNIWYTKPIALQYFDILHTLISYKSRVVHMCDSLMSVSYPLCTCVSSNIIQITHCVFNLKVHKILLLRCYYLNSFNKNVKWISVQNVCLILELKNKQLMMLMSLWNIVFKDYFTKSILSVLN